MKQPDMSPPPEADLIQVTRLAAHLTPPQAAARARAAGGKISDTYWRNVEQGHGWQRGRKVPSRASAEKLALMAAAVGVTPDQLRDVARGDAARVLEEILRRKGRSLLPFPSDASPPREDLPDAIAARLGAEPDYDAIWALVGQAIAAHPGEVDPEDPATIRGEWMWPGSVMAVAWDQMARSDVPGGRMTLREVVRSLAIVVATSAVPKRNAAATG